MYLLRSFLSTASKSMVLKSFGSHARGSGSGSRWLGIMVIGYRTTGSSRWLSGYCAIRSTANLRPTVTGQGVVIQRCRATNLRLNLRPTVAGQGVVVRSSRYRDSSGSPWQVKEFSLFANTYLICGPLISVGTNGWRQLLCSLLLFLSSLERGKRSI